MSSYLFVREVSAGHTFEETEELTDVEDLRIEEDMETETSELVGVKVIKEEVEQIEKLTISDVPINQNEQITQHALQDSDIN